ncbi:MULTISPECIES: bifunctional 2-polyprenyl-6-hydroxyphenol methylase/3-demethylubiquinol 3-O-methyltransferase UbiG [Flavobacterium]|uniref:Bifunctional 3-demethylubiquinone-9 3-methyltransferase/ 2-octaprenyl-6-hydroxy phenol methylase n=2 Tax=Flavobacterium TaxID=237 RepID=A0A437U822_9FLAO|nr:MULTISPECIES: methyltransferase domain-containing protein [Flavobacterium]OWP83054.1 SAM-dependent methyltransferase [Flavobacterium davisii]QYS88358.1 class I SAM-dependent methyltransferase [Flavobacterium davisii]RVU89745.1 class I SAM-dependent methyltransferase [Flavobacterium columnare]SPE78578.1 bifunctional 3-demethylubiquinone-9 3-methyltransferase/ 2-octaprenyl-6-hydroxy phenol methylase [Flavobacterium columnare]
MLDLFGKALLDYQTNNTPEPIITETNISEEDEMDVGYLFRSFKEMPKLEQRALNLSKGNVLDVGCGAGSHSLYLQEKGLKVTSLDVSKNAIETCKLRGIKNPISKNLIDFDTDERFDTILLLMNGTGIFGSLKDTSKYLQKLKNLLSNNGQIIIDSSDIIYMFDQDEDGAYEIPANGYYGELVFTIHYKGETEESFPWLYMDYNTLQNACHANGLFCELIEEGKHFDYLARIRK